MTTEQIENPVAGAGPAAPDRRPRRAGSIALGLCAWAPALNAWLPDRPYALDLLSHFTAHFAAITALLALIPLARRRFASAANALAAAAAAFALFAWAAPTPRQPPAPASARHHLRVALYNCKGEISPTPDGDPFSAWLLDQDADLVAVIEGPLHFPLSQPAITARYPYRVTPESGLMWPIVLLSRWPIEITPFKPRTPEWVESFLAHRSAIVTVPAREGAPETRILFAATHPPSPRKISTWRASLKRTRMEGDILAAVRRERGIPIIIAGDFNSTPVGMPHRGFAERSGLTGWWRGPFSGTWHAALPTSLSIPIDRVWTSPDITVTRLRTGPDLGSDHRPVIADLVID